MTCSQDGAGATLAKQSDTQPGPTSPKQKVEIVVIGDVYWDTVIVPLPCDPTNAAGPNVKAVGCGNDDAYARFDRRGGAWLLQILIKRATRFCDPSYDIRVKGYGLNVLQSDPDLQKLNADKWRRRLTVVKPFPKGFGDDAKKQVYRIRNGYGWVAPAGGYPVPEQYEDLFRTLDKAVNYSCKEETNIIRIAVIDDANHNFRHLSACKEIVAKLAAFDLLIISMAFPLVEGRLWEEIEQNPELRERTVVVISAAALRSHGANIRDSGALETIAYDLAHHAAYQLQRLMKCQHVLVRFSLGGVVHFCNEKLDKFSYYSLPLSGSPESKPDKYGTMAGYTKILIASIVREMFAMPRDYGIFDKNAIFKKLPEGLRTGLKFASKHFKSGFAPLRFHFKYLDSSDRSEPYPFEELFSDADPVPHGRDAQRPELAVGLRYKHDHGETRKVAEVELPRSLDTLRHWNRVEWIRDKEGSEHKFDEYLLNVVQMGLEGANESSSYPFAQFGELKSVDRDEIDGFVDVTNIILKYLGDAIWETPLSLAVFGPPGTGKSFTVGEILKEARASTATAGNGEVLVYNLAQFTEPKNLTIAFHQAQDAALSGKVPLIFFDEFDATFGSHPYGWLKYFLAPMQDGKFKGADTEGSYRVGKAIFVFAGGTAETFSDFKDEVAKEKNAKGPDFISRLRGYLNIKGINPVYKKNNNIDVGGLKREAENSVSESGLLALRRAIIFRSILERKAKPIFDGKNARIDPRLINAFLQIDSYEHGVRSMDAIVEMSKPEKGHLWVASLPSPDQLRMHVDVEKFLGLTRQEPFTSRSTN